MPIWRCVMDVRGFCRKTQPRTWLSESRFFSRSHMEDELRLDEEVLHLDDTDDSVIPNLLDSALRDFYFSARSGYRIVQFGVNSCDLEECRRRRRRT